MTAVVPTFISFDPSILCHQRSLVIKGPDVFGV